MVTCPYLQAVSPVCAMSPCSRHLGSLQQQLSTSGDTYRHLTSLFSNTIIILMATVLFFEIHRPFDTVPNPPLPTFSMNSRSEYSMSTGLNFFKLPPVISDTSGALSLRTLIVDRTVSHVIFTTSSSIIIQCLGV